MNPNKLARLKEDNIMCERANSIACMLNSIEGENADREGLKETPWRVAKMYDELFWGYTADPKQTLEDAMFKDGASKDLVLVKDINFTSMCEHHVMPFFGTVAVAYVPQDGRIVGLSKIARIVEIFSKRLQVQERLGQQIADVIEEVMNPRGIAVIIKAEHTCMTARGVQKPGAQTITSCLRGSFFLDEKAREELVELLKY